MVPQLSGHLPQGGGETRPPRSPDRNVTAPPLRLRGLPIARVLGYEVPVAGNALSRLLGLALLDPDRAGPGLFFPGCCSVHTFGMRFTLKVVFLDREGGVLQTETEVEPGRILFERRASAVLELRSGGLKGGDLGGAGS